MHTVEEADISLTGIEQRSALRYKRAILTAIGALGSKAISIATLLISVPLTLHYLGSERYGLWLTITSTVGMFTFADLGVSYGLINLVAEADGKDDLPLAAAHISNTFYLLFTLAAILGSSFGFLYQSFHWAQLFNVRSTQAALEAGPAIAVVVYCFLIRMPLSVVQGTQLGLQEGFINDLCSATGNIVGLLGLLMAVSIHAGLPALALSISAGPVVALAVNYCWLFYGHRRDLRPTWRKCRAELLAQMSNLSLLFLVLQVAAALAYASDDIIIAHALGPDAVAQYSIPRRLFNIFPTLTGLAFTALWPAYGEAKARGDAVWIRKTVARSVLGSSIVSFVAAIVLVLSGRQLLRIWVGRTIDPSFVLLLGFACWIFIRTPFDAIGVFLSGSSIVWFQVCVGTIMASVCFISKLLVVRHWGIAGMIWTTVVVYFLCSGIPMMLYAPTILNRIAPLANTPRGIAGSPESSTLAVEG